MSQPRSLLRRLVRRPSPAMGVALVALFLAAGGVSYAAVAIPANSISNTMLKNNSVGTIKLRQNSVTYQKIAPGSVGTNRIDQKEVQESVNGNCTTGHEAITAIAEKGTVTCGPTLPAESDSGTGANTSLTSSTVPTTVANYGLAGGSSYLVQADAYATVVPGATGAVEHVTVSCTLAAGSATTSVQTRSATLTLTSGGVDGYTSIPLTVTEPSNANSTVAEVTCTQASDAGTPSVSAQATIYSLQTASNTSATSAG